MMMTDPFTLFRGTVCGVHLNEPWAFRLQRTLGFLGDYPQYGPFIGLMPCGSNAIFVNPRNCAQFFGLRNRSSCNRNFQQHGFVLDRECNVERELRTRFPGVALVTRGWTKRIFALGEFNSESSQEKIAQASLFARDVRRGLRSPSLSKSEENTSPEKRVNSGDGRKTQSLNMDSQFELRL
jgi:hypothetical protein